MKRRSWVFWLLLVGSLLLAVMTVSLYLVFRGLNLTTPRVSAGSTLTVDTARRFPEDPLYDLSGPFFEVRDITFRDLLQGIRRAKTDTRVDRLLLRVRGLQLGWAGAYELRSELEDFKGSGKPLTAFVEFASNMGYYLASAADEIYLHPQSMLDLRGLKAEVTFMKSTLDKLGVEAEFERIGAYKNAPDTWLRRDMSEAQREALGEILATLEGVIVSAIAEARGLSEEEVGDIMDQGPLLASDALRLGLVDALKYQDEVESAVEGEEGSFEGISIVSYQRSRTSATGRGPRAEIAVIYGLGAIVPGTSSDDFFAGRVMGSDTIAKAFEEVRTDDSIDAVVFRIDSPGGSDVASDVIWREATLTREKKPVIVSMGNVAASGGYWIATASDAIVAQPTTITGSIGIFAGKFNLSGFYEKVGFSKDSVTTSPSADFFSDTRSFTEEERRRLRRVLEDGYRHFLEKVAASRQKTTEEVDAIAQGRIWSGRMALEHGLVDELGGLDRAIRLAKERAGFDESAAVDLRLFPRKRSYFEALLTDLVTTRASMQPMNLRQLAEESPYFRLLVSGERLALMPFSVELK